MVRHLLFLHLWILWGVAVLSSFLAAMGFACAWRGRSGKLRQFTTRSNEIKRECELTFIYFVASSNGRIPDFDSEDSSSNLLAIAVVL